MGHVFISYCHKDEKWKDKIVDQLGVFKNQGKLEIWDDRQIGGGEDWLRKIELAIQECDVALLLISANFLNSGFILKEEIPLLLKRKAGGKIPIIPIILWPCQWRSVEWLSTSLARPKDGVPLSKFRKKVEVEEILSNLAAEVRHLLHLPMSNHMQHITTPGPINEETVNNFLEMIPANQLRKNVRDHFKLLISLQSETPDTEDHFIQARRNFWESIGQDQEYLIAFLRQYIASALLSLDSFMVAYEFGRILSENRRGHLAYEILAPLEDQMRMGLVDVPGNLKSKILDGIGESARFADNFAAAKRLYNAALEIEPNDYFALKHLGTIFRIENNLLKAKECFEKALGIRKTYHVLFSLAYLYHDLKYYNEAKPIYNQCVQVLNELNKEHYYRVYFKMACLHLIRRGPEASEEALKCSMQTLKSLKICSQNTCKLDDFALITRFAAYLLITLVHEKKSSAVDALLKCETFLNCQIDRLTHSPFYCAYGDIERVLAENNTLLPTAFRKLGATNANRLEHILDQMQLKHLLLQASVAHGRMRSLAVATEHIEVLIKPIEILGRENDALREAMSTFEFPSWRSPGAEHASLETCKIAIASTDVAISSMRTSIESLLDRASVSLWLKSAKKDRAYDGASILKPFTAVLPESIRSKHFADHFYVSVLESEAIEMVRILGKKLMCLDPLTKNRVFINPTIGCNLACEYCYLPEYSIAHNKVPPPGEIDGATYRAALEYDKRMIRGKDGSLLSIGSFCEPFLPEVANQTVNILRALEPLRNSIQIATKCFPGASAFEDIIAIFADEPEQLMINLSLNDFDRMDKQQIKNWLNRPDNICICIYIKPFLSKTTSQLSRFIELGNSYPQLSFVVGSFYVGESIRQKPTSGYKFDCYRSNPGLVSPVVDEPKVMGFKETGEDNFRKELTNKIGRPAFKTASCALSCKRKVKDPLRNYETSFCIRDHCSNYGHICPDGSAEQ